MLVHIGVLHPARCILTKLLYDRQIIRQELEVFSRELYGFFFFAELYFYGSFAES